MEELVKAQKGGSIVIKKCDKGGGIAVMKTEDYISEMEGQLRATFKGENGEIPFYKPATESDLKSQERRVKELIDVGVTNGFISEQDKHVMQPLIKQIKRIQFTLSFIHQPQVHSNIKTLRNVFNEIELLKISFSLLKPHYANGFA